MFSPVMSGHHGGYLVHLQHKGLTDGCPIRFTLWEDRADALRYIELMSRNEVQFGNKEVDLIVKAFKYQARESVGEIRLRELSWDEAKHQAQVFFNRLFEEKQK